MDTNEERLQLEEIKTQLRRVERVPVRTSNMRKDTFKRLIELAHSPYSSLKSVAAINIKNFVKDFPELEDDALNAVYDLCEDPVAKVRIEGYQAIIQVSKEQKKWVKRNADVLVQLLQSDEPDEVLVVKKALTEHLDMGPFVTLGVLCDQIVPLEDAQDEEEQIIRDRLRTLVLAFISGEAKRAIVERHATVTGSPAEEVLVTSLLKALTKSTAEIDVIVRDILLALPSFSKSSPRGEQLLETLLGEAKTSLKIDLPRDDSRSSLPRTQCYLDLATMVAVDKQVAHPSQLLRFFCAHLVSKITLARLTEDLQVYVLSNTAEILSVCEALSPSPDFTPGDLTSLRNQVVAACPSLLSSFIDVSSDEKRPWKACATLLRTCRWRNAESKWTIPSHFVPIIEKIQGLAEKEQQAPKAMDKESVGEVHNLSRSLLQTIEASKSPPATTAPPSTSTPPGSLDTNISKGMTRDNKNKNAASRVIIDRQRSRVHHPLPQAPIPTSTSNTPVSNGIRPITPSAPRAERQRQAQKRTSAPNRQRNVSGAPQETPAMKPVITNNGGENGSTPSLLSRLGGGPGPSSPVVASPTTASSIAPQSQGASIPAKRRAEAETPLIAKPTPREPPVDVDMDPVVGFSIKGAATRAAGAGAVKESGQSNVKTTSLLDRMKADDSYGEGSERRGRKRTKKS